MAENFYTILTTLGKSKLANSVVLGTKVNLKTLQIGDGNGTYHEPSENQISLINKVWDGEISSISVDESNSNWIVIQTIIPASDGGFYIREAGIFDEDGDLFAVSKVSETYKPMISEGSSKDVQIKILLEVSNQDSITLRVDSNVVVATKNDIEVLGFEIQSVNNQLLEKANTVSPTFSGIPTAPTAAFGTNDTQIATTAFVNNVLAGMPSNLVFSNSGTLMRGIQGAMGENNYWRIGGCGTASDAGYLELGTADGGNEPIYVRQYGGTFSSIVRTLTLLDERGNTSVPGNLAIGGTISSVGNTSVVTNLNADLLDGVDGSAYYRHVGDTVLNANLDTIEIPGTYRVNGICTGIPSTIGADICQHAILSVINIGNGLVRQELIITNNTAYAGWASNVFVRSRSFSAAWAPWTRLSTTSRYDLSLLNGWSMSYLKPRISRSGAIATLNLKIKGGTISSGTNLCIIPQEYRPSSGIYVPVTDINGNKLGSVGIYETGNVSLVTSLSSSTLDAHITASWTVDDLYYI